MSQERKVVLNYEAPEGREGEGFVVHRPFPGPRLSLVDPLLLFDEMGPSDHGPGEAIGTAPHPHRGFETLTYVIAGGIAHRDSFDNQGVVHAGGAQQMTTGAGIVHEEKPSDALLRDGGRMHAIQMWINLPRDQKMMAPGYRDIPAEQIPEIVLGEGALARLVSGEMAGQTSPVQTVVPTRIVDLHLEASASGAVPIPEGWNAMAFVVAGSGRVGNNQTALERGHFALFGNDGETVPASAGEDGMRVLIVSGQPLSEPVSRYGPFVMNEPEEIEQAIRDFQAGKMGAIKPREMA
ncbi:redox-sensitive bicupin YhaK (pirin superfamily) [Natronospira proteinivora]|uniref:Redox-sensitive bicupin YhaK (Pirin superfamily) n=1 Tax=Natronospira proteinivora TaxID=1807133 RepID=A0ABT1G9C5_9GAMM|nr:pirin family protein [Natronospira proteinivora]MCP1727925.1 redox-sensitive bicupin YhaK (pirin superfamily) [Natronospira proteinivora]